MNGVSRAELVAVVGYLAAQFRFESEKNEAESLAEAFIAGLRCAADPSGDSAAQSEEVVLLPSRRVLPPLSHKAEIDSSETTAPREIIDEWNRLVELPRAGRSCRLTDGRQKKIGRLMKRDDFASNWKCAVSMVASSEFLNGENESGWKATLDFFLQYANYVKILEGNYAPPPRARPSKGQRRINANRSTIVAALEIGGGTDARPAGTVSTDIGRDARIDATIPAAVAGVPDHSVQGGSGATGAVDGGLAQPRKAQG